MIWISIMLITTPSVLSDEREKLNLHPYMGDISSQLYVALGNETKVYKMSNVEEMMNDSRRHFVVDPGLLFREAHMKQRSLICYMTSVTYRAANWNVYRYFHVRDLYVENLEYEIGYLTQEVMYHYEVILEIYQMVERRYIQYPDRNFGPINYNFFLYANILEKSKIIIHLCNMMHELEDKYIKKKSKSIFAEYEDGPVHKGTLPPKLNTSSVDLLKMEYQKKLAQKAKEEKKLQKERKEYNKKLAKFGMTTRRKRKLKKKGVWPIDYGWSIEDW